MKYILLGLLLAAAAVGQDHVPTRYRRDIVDLRHGLSLDLDTGGMFDAANSHVQCELALSRGKRAWLGEWRSSPEASAALGGDWRTRLTDRGRRVWVRPFGRDLPVSREDLQVSWALETIVQEAGDGSWLPPPRVLVRALGDRLALVWGGHEEYERYRIQLVPVDARPEEQALVDREYWLVPSAPENEERRSYRVTGITPRGDEGVPTLVQVRAGYSGAYSGSFTVANGSGVSYDLIRELKVESGGDLDIAWMGVATINDRNGLPLWKGNPFGDRPAGVRFELPLLGGGVASCQLAGLDGRRNQIIEYEVRLDDDAEDTAGYMALIAEDGAIRIEIEIPRGARVLSISRQETPTSERVAVDPVLGVDSAPPWGELLVYVALVEIIPGLPPAELTAMLDRRPDEPVSGEFELAPGDGWSFFRSGLASAEDADIVLERLLGSSQRAWLLTPGGARDLDVVGRSVRELSEDEAFAFVIGVNGSLLTTKRAIRTANQREDRVFVLRLSHGGWAKLQQLKGPEGKARFRYVTNPRRPHFGQSDDEVEVNGIVLDLTGLTQEKAEPFRLRADRDF